MKSSSLPGRTLTTAVVPLICLIGVMSHSAYSQGPAMLSPTSPETVLSLPDAPQPAWQVVEDGENDSADGSAQISANSARTISAPQFGSFQERKNNYLHEMFGPTAFIGPIFPSVFDQLHELKVAYPPEDLKAPGAHSQHGAVPEWGQGFNGYAKRYASRYGQGLIGTTVRYGLGEVLREDVTYHRCACTGTLHRASYAVMSSLVAHTASGRAIPSLPALLAPFVASEVAVEAWYPARYNISDGFRTSTGGYIALPIKNLITEFSNR